MATEMHGWVTRIGTLGTSALALIVLVTPLAMWVSWTEGMFTGVILTGIVAAALSCLLDRPWRPASGRPPASSRTVSDLDDESVRELSNLNPMIYHNRCSAEPRVQAVFEKLKHPVRRER